VVPFASILPMVVNTGSGFSDISNGGLFWRNHNPTLTKPAVLYDNQYQAVFQGNTCKLQIVTCYNNRIKKYQ
jgi:hypothetical protein